MTKPFVSQRDHRFHHSVDALDFIERTNCAKGCTVPTGMFEEGPSGNCPILAQVRIGDGEPIPELSDGGTWVRCEKRIPPPPALVVEPEPEPPVQTEALFDVGDPS